MLIPKGENIVRETGNISFVDIKNGSHGYFGTINLAVDASYRNPQLPKGQQWVEKTTFIPMDINKKFIQEVGGFIPQVGGRLSIIGKLIVSNFKDPVNGHDRSALKVKITSVESFISKAEREQLKSMGWCGNNQQAAPNNNQGSYQQAEPHNNQGGYQQAAPQYNQN